MLLTHNSSFIRQNQIVRDATVILCLNVARLRRIRFRRRTTGWKGCRLPFVSRCFSRAMHDFLSFPAAPWRHPGNWADWLGYIPSIIESRPIPRRPDERAQALTGRDRYNPAFALRFCVLETLKKSQASSLYH
jgi:hypothetical protein